MNNYKQIFSEMAAPSQGLSQHQQQLLRLNMRQVLLGRLLEMSTPEFEEEIVRAIEENPAITTLDSVDSEMLHDANAPEFDDEDIYGSDSDDSYLSRNPFTRHRSFFSPSDDSTAADSVMQQVGALSLSDIERETIRYIIGNLDSSGYLTRTPAEISDDMALTAALNVPVDTVRKMIDVVRSLDPAGIGATDLRDSLMLQLARMKDKPEVRLAREILRNHYKDFINNRLDTVRSAIGADHDDFERAIRLIRSLNPKPAAGLFDHEADDRTRHIVPDFIIDIDDDGRPAISLAGHIPELTIEPSFRHDPDAEENDELPPAAAEFIRERREGAGEFIEAVRRRGSTLMSIMRAIVRLQPEYFHTFELHDLRPMVIRDIEEITGLDKSIISRATSSKYMLTPDGVVALRSLFGESASSTTNIAPREVEAAIRRLVGDEDKTDPLSDDELTAMLAAMGMNVARRTVAKYRERIGIPVARLRKNTL